MMTKAPMQDDGFLSDAATPTVTQLAYEIATQVRHAREQLLSARDDKQLTDRLATVLLCSTASTFLAIAIATGDPQILNLCRLLVHS
jgi:hypothetical protein